MKEKTLNYIFFAKTHKNKIKTPFRTFTEAALQWEKTEAVKYLLSKIVLLFHKGFFGWLNVIDLAVWPRFIAASREKNVYPRLPIKFNTLHSSNWVLLN